jgi:hypothetical protein
MNRVLFSLRASDEKLLATASLAHWIYFATRQSYFQRWNQIAVVGIQLWNATVALLPAAICHPAIVFQAERLCV